MRLSTWEGAFAQVLEKFTTGDTPGSLKLLQSLAPTDAILAALARHAANYPEAALLAVLRVAG